MKRLLIVFWVGLLLGACNSTPSEGAIRTAIAETKAAEISDSPPDLPSPNPTAVPTNAPTQLVEEIFIAQLDLTSSHLFNAGDDPANAALRDYANSFTQADARVIYCEVIFSHPGPKEDVGFVMWAIYYGPDGNVYGEVDIEPVIKVGWQMSNWLIGYGWNDPGHWDVGNYQMELLIDDNVIASKTFEILKDTPTPEATPTSTPMPGAVVETNSLNVRKGPGTMYPIVTGLPQGERLDILGQAYNCGWLKIETSKGIEGWVSAELVRFELPCSEIPAASIPATPIPMPTAMPTAIPTVQAPQGKTITIKIINNTGGNITINLSGPATYSFTFGTGTHNMQVIPGTYTYTVWGCGTSTSGSKNLNKVDEWTWFCN
jgi:hypothetical protein